MKLQSNENNIPKHWQVKKLSEIGKSVTGTTPPKNDTTNYGNDVPFVKPPQLFDSVITNAPEKLSTKGASLARILPVNSVLITCIGNLGRTAINKIPVAFNQQINAVIPSNDIDGKFLFYQAQSHNFKSQLDKLSSATTVAIVNKGKFETIKIVLPPLTEQLAIVSKIEELLSDLENGKQQLLTAQQQLKVYRQSLLKAAFTSTTLSERRTSSQSEAEAKNHNVQNERSSSEVETKSELRKGWRIVELSEVADMCLGKMLDKSKNKGNYQYYLRNISVHWGSFELDDLEQMRFEESENERFGLKKGDLIVCEGGEPGRCAIWNKENSPIKIQKALHRVRVNDKLDVKFLFYFLYYSGMTGLLEKYFTGTTIKHLTGSGLKKVKIPLPTLSEQQQIVEILESKLTVCDKIEETINQSLLQAETLKQSILKKAFEGKLVC